MAHPLMPKATAVWLIDNTGLTFRQIAEFCGLHDLEVQAIADGDVAIGMQGLDPVTAGELTAAEIERCAADPNGVLQRAEATIPLPKARNKGARYTPVSKRQDRPDGIAWLLKNYPELTDAQLCKLVGTTKPTITSVRERTHWNATNIKPQNPVGLGLCAAQDLEKAVAVARARAGNVHGGQAPAATTQPVATPPVATPPPANVPVDPFAPTAEEAEETGPAKLEDAEAS
jgi:hypothetical protein